MPINVPNPYSGEDAETCSVSFAAQQEMAGTVGSPQTEAQWSKSKLLGEWGVIKGKLAKGEIPNGTKLMAYTNIPLNSRGYLYVKGGKLWKRVYLANGKQTDSEVPKPDTIGELFINSTVYKVAIPEAVGPKPKPEPDPLAVLTSDDMVALKNTAKNGDVVAVTEDGLYKVTYHDIAGFTLLEKAEYGFMPVQVSPSGKIIHAHMKGTGKDFLKPDASGQAKKAPPPSPPPQPVAAPTPAAPVDAASPSVGSMSHEDVAALFVKTKDDLAKEKGLNIKGSNPELDQEVFKAIGDAIGYTPAEVKAKIDAYKAAGNKLSALKKKVLAGTKQVPTLKPTQKPAAPSKPLVGGSGGGSPDPKPHGVPTVATSKVAQEVKAEVKKATEAQPAKVYSSEDVAAQYIMRKDEIVGASDGKWTLYTKSDELESQIAAAIQAKTGLNPAQQKEKVAEYLASGKKLSVLKKQLIKQGAFEPKADTLKKSGAAKGAAEKAKEVNDKADAGYTPTPNPATGTPKTETGKPPPKAAQKSAEEAGDITGISSANQQEIFYQFKQTGSKSWLSSGPGQNYEGLVAAKAAAEATTGKTFTLLQIIRVVDEQGAKKAGVANGKLFEKQVATWLTTPEGTSYIKEAEAKLAKEAEAKAKAAKDKAEAEKIAQKLRDNQPALPADSAQYTIRSREWGYAFFDKAVANRDNPLTDEQKKALTYYTTNPGYTAMNGQLRGEKPHTTSVQRNVKRANAGMRPTTEPILLHRGTTARQFGFENYGDNDKLWGITGRTFKDEGFLSTSVGGSAAFSGKPVLMEIECPVGTPMQYLQRISKYPNEAEMLLASGIEYKVLRVDQKDGKFHVRMRVVNWPGKDS